MLAMFVKEGEEVPILTIVERAAVQLISHNLWTIVSWDTEVQDDPGAFDIGSPTLVTVPTGYTKVRVTVNTSWDNNSLGMRFDSLFYDSASIRVCMISAHNESGKNWITTWLPVTAGKQFYLEVYQSCGGNLNLNGNDWPAPSQMQFEWRA